MWLPCTPEGALYTYYWSLPGPLSELAGGSDVFHCPMHDEPLRLIPHAWREETIKRLGLGVTEYKFRIDGEVNPACRLIFKELMRHHEGDFAKVMAHVRVRRLVLSEQDRIGALAGPVTLVSLAGNPL